MIAGLPLSFAEPFLLLGLLSLPVLWWLLRVMPPRPRRIEFPPTRLLFDIAPKEETPVAHAVVADGVAPAGRGAGDPGRRRADLESANRRGAGSRAPLVILLDDGWSAASSWDTRIKAADELIANADNDRRGVALVPLSEPARDITLMPGRHRARRAAPVRAQALFDRAGRNPARDRAFPESNRRLRDRLAVGRRRYRARAGVRRRP